MRMSDTAPEGIILAATGERHLTLARRAARTIRPFAGGRPIDLFADRPLDDPAFDRVHLLERNWHRPKVEALRRSRFARTLYIDNDVVAVGPIGDVFGPLDRVDMLGAHENYRSSPSSLSVSDPRLTLAFPEVNSGVLAIRASPAMHRFLVEWEAEIDRSGLPWDQPALRQCLVETDLRFGILPMEFNLMHTRFLHVMGDLMAAPRLLHVTRLGRDGADPGDPTTPYDATAILSPHNYRRLQELIAGDRNQGTGPTLRRRPGKAN